MSAPNCADCGRFVSCDEGYYYFTPDSEYTVESMEWLCSPCSAKERERKATRLRQEFRVVP